jgi:hypothetical protein
LHRVHEGVYAVGHPNLPLEGHFLAAVKACGEGALLSHYAAGALFGLVRWDGRRIEVTVPGTAVRRHARVLVHRTLRMESDDRSRHRGIPVTSPSRTLLDLSPLLSPRHLRRAVREALALRIVSVSEIVAALSRLGPRTGSRRLASVVADAATPTRSMLEDVVLDLLDRGGFERPDVNVPLVLDGRRVVPDFRWPAQHLVVEADGAAWHDHRVAREDDAERQALLEAHGQRVLRVTWRQAVARPAETLARIAAAGAPPAAACHLDAL